MIKNNKFKEIGDNVKIYDPVTIINPELFVLKNNIIISEYCYLSGGLGLFIGNFIHIASQSNISGGGHCVLDDFTSICAGVKIITGSEDISGHGLTNPTIPDEFRTRYKAYVHCRKHSFIASNVTLYPNVVIGEGAVACSGSTVTNDLEPWSINAGYPARKIKDRPREMILNKEKELLKNYPFSNSNFNNITKNFQKD